MAQTQYREPEWIAAGDSISFVKRLSNYPSGQGWSLDIEIRGGAQVISFQSTADADNVSHDVTVTSATTAGWLPGQMLWIEYAVNTGLGQRNQVFEQNFEIKPNFPVSTGDVSVKTFKQIMVEKLEDILKSVGDSNLLRSKVEGTEFEYMTFQQLEQAHGYWYTARKNEIAMLRAQNGQDPGVNIRPKLNVMLPGPVVGSNLIVGPNGGAWPFG